jgi:hypothetical protein
LNAVIAPGVVQLGATASPRLIPVNRGKLSKADLVFGLFYCSEDSLNR